MDSFGTDLELTVIASFLLWKKKKKRGHVQLGERKMVMEPSVHPRDYSKV